MDDFSEDLLTFLFLQHGKFFLKACAFAHSYAPSSYSWHFQQLSWIVSTSLRNFPDHTVVPPSGCSVSASSVWSSSWHNTLCNSCLLVIVNHFQCISDIKYLALSRCALTYLLNTYKYFLNEWVNYWICSVTFRFCALLLLKCLQLPSPRPNKTCEPVIF